jgi:cytochrome c
MKRTIFFSVLVIFLMAGFCMAAEKGTAKEAEALVKKAIAYYNANGKVKALAEFSNTTGKFTDVPKGLFIFAYDFNGKCVAQGANPGMVGKELIGLKDPDGKPLIKDMIEIAKTKGHGWYDYKWTNPVTKKLEPKSSYVERVEDVMIGCGFYKTASE